MDNNLNTYSLPPLTHGKVLGILKFIINEVNIIKTILVATKDFNFIVKIQWWGEVVPMYLRQDNLLN